MNLIEIIMEILKLNYNISLLDARYVSWEVPATVSSQDGRWVENAPGIISRVNIDYSINKFSAMFSWSHVGETYSDAGNSAALSGPNSRGVNGKIPSYNVLDLSVRYDINKFVSLSASMNNITNNHYFTRRAGGYPGPGIMPADGRTALITLGIKL
jgi:Fe(3+) dicitrate transport protein